MIGVLDEIRDREQASLEDEELDFDREIIGEAEDLDESGPSAEKRRVSWVTIC